MHGASGPASYQRPTDNKGLPKKWGRGVSKYGRILRAPHPAWPFSSSNFHMRCRMAHFHAPGWLDVPLSSAAVASICIIDWGRSRRTDERTYGDMMGEGWFRAWGGIVCWG